MDHLPGQFRSRGGGSRLGACLLTLAMLGESLAGLSSAHPAAAAISRGAHHPLGVHQQDGAPEKRSASYELDGVKTASIDPAMTADKVMRSRPFIVGDDTVKILYAKPAQAKETTEESGKAELVAFLQKRNLGESQIAAAVNLFGDRRTRKVIPSPKLRAALLMMTDWDPYQATIDAILKGKNPSGKPFIKVSFEEILEGAIAMQVDEAGTGYHQIAFSKKFAKEPAELLLCTMMHESLHGGGPNSAEEEIIANLLGDICYAEVLLIEPDLADAGTDLTYISNVELVALLNSLGRAGPAELGIATSNFGDVFIGIGMDDADAESVRAAIEHAWLYDALLNVGSKGKQTTAQMLHRFPNAKSLGATPAYSEQTIAVIDAGVSTIIPQAKAVALAKILKLEIVTAFTEGKAVGAFPADAAGALGKRPITPQNMKYFDFRYGGRVGKPLTEATGLKALADALAASPADETAKKALLAKYADPAVIALIPDPSLRAALLLLGGWRPWDLTLGVVLDGANPDGVPLQIFFTDLRDSAPAVRQSDVKNDGTPAAIVINSLLKGESPVVLAAAIVEGTLLHDDTLTKDEVVASSALGTLAWANLIAAMPGAAKAKTWGTITRNIGLLALLNSAAAGGAGIGVLAPATGVQDILHGVYLDSNSFSAFADGRPWGVHFDRQAELEAPPIFIDYLTFAGAPPTPGIGGIVSLSDKTLANLDSAMGVLLSPAALMADASALSLEVGH